MVNKFDVACCALIAAMVSAQATAQTTLVTPYGGSVTKPVPVSPPADPKATPESIAKDAARDLSPTHFYNKPGATRAQFDADWQECRLIARGSRTPAGVTTQYVPAGGSVLASGIGGGIGAAIGTAIVEGQQRRANRRACLLIRGWRLVEVPAASAAKVTAMSDDQRDAYLNSVVGATQVDGKVTERTSFAQPSDPALKLDAPLTGPGTVYLGKKADPTTPMMLGPDEAAIVFAYRRPDEDTAGRSALLQLSRYDVAGRDLVYRPKDWKKTGDKTVYDVLATSADRKAAYEVQVVRVTPGDYVIASAQVILKVPMTTNCFGAPTLHVGAGEVAYLGDFLPYAGAKLATGKEFAGLAYASHIDDARRTLATTQPMLAAAMKPATLANRATYGCSAIQMNRWDLPGIGSLPDLPVSG